VEMMTGKETRSLIDSLVNVLGKELKDFKKHYIE